MSTTTATSPTVDDTASPFTPAAITTLYPLQPSERAAIDSVLEKRSATQSDRPSSPTSTT